MKMRQWVEYGTFKNSCSPSLFNIFLYKKDFKNNKRNQTVKETHGLEAELEGSAEAAS